MSSESTNPSRSKRSKPSKSSKSTSNTTSNSSQAIFRPRSPTEAPSSVIQQQISAQEQQDPIKLAPIRASIQLPVDPAQQQIASLRVRPSQFHYALLFEELGYLGILDAAWGECQMVRPQHSFVTSSDSSLSELNAWKVAGVPLLSDIPPAILQSLLDSTLSHKICVPAPEHNKVFEHFDRTNLDAFLKVGHAAKISYWVTRQQALTFTPVIYVRIFHGKDGLSPTPKQLRQVLEYLRMYVSGLRANDKVCAEIDNQTRPTTSTEADIAAGRHYYLKGKDTRAEQLLTFIAALSQALDGQVPPGSAAQDLPFARTLKYFGYTKDFARRTREHDTDSSSWLMELFDHVCRLLFRDEARVPVFRFESYVVAYPISYQECQIGHELLCRSGGGYYYTGLGFNIQDAGVRVTSADLSGVPHGVATGMWKACEDARNSNPIWETRLCADFNQFFDKYLAKCNEASGADELQRLDAEELALDQELEKAKVEMSEVLQTLQDQYKQIESIDDEELRESMLREQTSLIESARKRLQDAEST
jgi:hypothetical protein